MNVPTPDAMPYHVTEKKKRRKRRPKKDPKVKRRVRAEVGPKITILDDGSLNLASVIAVVVVMVMEMVMERAASQLIKPATTTPALPINRLTYIGEMAYFTALSACVWTEKRNDGAAEAGGAAQYS